MTKTKPAEPALFEQEQVATPEPKRRNAVAKVETLPPPAQDNMLSIIASAAANPAVDVGKMRELLSMQREIMAESARIAFTEAMVGMKLPSIGRDGKIDEGITKSGRQGKKTMYATFENIDRAVKPILKDNGFNLWFEPDVGEDGKIIMRGHLDHIKGHGKTCAISLPLETQNKNNLQGIGSSISYGKRYAAIALLNIVSHAPEDHDMDGNEADKISEEQVERIRALIVESGADIKRFCEYAKIQKIEELPSSRYDAAIAMLEKKKGAKQ